MTAKFDREKGIGKPLLLTIGFTQAGVYVRRQFSGNFEVYRPQEHL
jgi:hypothetical protein